MVFSSVIFLCGFLPIVLVLYYLLPVCARNLWLFLASLFFYAWGEPVYVLIMLFSTVFDYTNGRLIAYFDAKGKQETASRAVLILSLVGNLGILGFFKYTNFVLEMVNALSGRSFSLLQLTLPIGISFYTFQTLSYTIDVYRGKVEAQKNIITFGMYVAMFPQLIAGPIVRYAEIAQQVDDAHRESWEKAAEGFERFFLGLAKKVLLANQAGEVFSQLSVLREGQLSMGTAWLGAIFYTFQIYFDFSGYSDMAIGLGQLFGFSFPENFKYPYQSKSITEFWRRWHITLSSWFREYLYIPLGGNRKGVACQVRNLFIVWFLTGLWHGAGWNFIFWGLYYFALLMLEKFLLHRWQKYFPAFWHFYTMFFVVIGWVIFAFEDIGQIKAWLFAMFAVRVPLWDTVAAYEWRNNIVFLLLLAVGATEFPKKLMQKLGKTLVRILTFVLLFFCAAFLVSGSYNPFLYFRF